MQSINALYVISYDYALEKVARYSRIPLDKITRITKGEIVRLSKFFLLKVSVRSIYFINT